MCLSNLTSMTIVDDDVADAIAKQSARQSAREKTHSLKLFLKKENDADML
uniref:Uncharacterized protein n=1 Tax=Peronospora matthiolae TaxID=2874970 RepID=A0AAV1TGW1_9STRA